MASVDQPVILQTEWAEGSQKSLEEFLETVTMTVTLDGKPVDLWTVIGPETQLSTGTDGVERETVALYYYWVVPEITAGAHETVLSVDYTHPLVTDYDLDGDGEPDVEDSFAQTCTFRAQ
ncbi:hypothetical protein ACFLYO_08240 [Chloroflexota bacterium]